MHWVSRSANSVGLSDPSQESAGESGRENQLFASGNRVWIAVEPSFRIVEKSF